ncbi:hypothetical protein LMG19089_02946 [Ralstonia edaphis]|nr:hypothetical protein LMG19089_02946 [Ralstonia sp. LMG 6871]CAJ0719481.1 hypothetical protein LMG6871_02894 [Ralstonia sp. LMG 6871]
MPGPAVMHNTTRMTANPGRYSVQSTPDVEDQQRERYPATA